MRVRPIERAVLGMEVDGLLAGLGVEVEVEVEVGVDVCAEGVLVEALLWPNSWANLTSFHIPTEELTIKVVAKVVILAIAWSICGYHLSRMVSVAFAVAKVAV